MCNHVYKKGGKKVCRPITSRADYMQACNSTRNIDNWNKYRETGEDRSSATLWRWPTTAKCRTANR